MLAARVQGTKVDTFDGVINVAGALCEWAHACGPAASPPTRNTPPASLNCCRSPGPAGCQKRMGARWRSLAAAPLPPADMSVLFLGVLDNFMVQNVVFTRRWEGKAGHSLL